MPENGYEDASGAACAGRDNRLGMRHGRREILAALATTLSALVTGSVRILGTADKKLPGSPASSLLLPLCSMCPCRASMSPSSGDAPDSFPRPFSSLPTSNYGHVALWGRQHCQSISFLIRTLPLFQEEEEEAPCTLQARDTGRHKWSHHRHLFFTAHFQGDLSHDVQISG